MTDEGKISSEAFESLKRQAEDFDRRLRMEVAASDEAWEGFISARTERIRAEVEARVRAEVAEERAKIVADALLAARVDLHGVAVRLRAKAAETGDKTHEGTAAGVALACFRLAELSDRAGSSPDTTPEPQS